MCGDNTGPYGTNEVLQFQERGDKMKTILLVEADPQIMNINAEMLKLRGYMILQASTAEECRHRLHWYTVDLVVLDTMLPDEDGLILCKEIKEKYHVCVLILSARGESEYIVKGLRAGGDDYLAKPYDLEVLAARIEARLRSSEERNRYLFYGSLKMDLLWSCGYLDGEDMLLTPREFSVLLLLVRNAGSLIQTSELAKEIWHDDSEGSVQTLWTLISRLRKKLCSDRSRIVISSVRGEGYMLEMI